MGTSAIGGMNVILSANAASFSAGIAQAQAKLNAFARVSKATGHSAVTDTQAASAAIRALEGGMQGNIRAAERFLATIPGVGKALQAAFPLVGAIAVAGIFVRMGNEAAKFIETLNKLPQAINNGFRTLNLSAISANDSLAVTNDRLANEIAKLEGKPQNNLKLAIDEARVAADKLASALDSDNTKVVELLQRNHGSAIGGFLGKAGTADVEGSIGAYEQKFADLGDQRNIAVHAGDPAAVARLDKALADAQASALNYAATQIQQRSNQGPGGLDQSANIADLRGFANNIRTAQDRQSLEATNDQLEAQKARLQAAKDLQETQKKLAEQAKQAQEAIVAQWHKDLEEAKADNDMTLAQEGQFWVRRMEQAKSGSLSYVEALDEANKTIARMRQENMRAQAGLDETAAKSYLPSAMDQSRDDTGFLAEQGREAANFVRGLNQQIELQRQNQNALDEASIRTEEATGRLSRLDAATQLAALHTREYTQYLQQLAAARAAIAADTGLSGLEKAQATAGINAQAIQAGGQRSIQQLQDQQAIASQTIGGAVKQSLDQMVQSFNDMAASLKELIPRTFNSLNDNIVKAMTGQKTNFGATFMQAGQGLLRTGLQRAEGSLFGALGFGKADGSSEGNALWVRMATGVAGGGAVSGLLGKFIQPFIQGHFAGGGDVLAGYPAMVGERGPEMFIPRSAGSIVPNSQLGGGGDVHYYNINAQGATDPAAINAAVARALPHAVAASIRVQHQMGIRRPQVR